MAKSWCRRSRARAKEQGRGHFDTTRPIDQQQPRVGRSALTFPHALRSLILSSTVADIPQLRVELDRLRTALGSDTMAMMQRYEAEGRFDHPEYLGAITVLNYRHVCRLSDWPAPVRRSVNEQVFPNSSHVPFYEEPHLYYPALLKFLTQHRS